MHLKNFLIYLICFIPSVTHPMDLETVTHPMDLEINIFNLNTDITNLIIQNIYAPNNVYTVYPNPQAKKELFTNTPKDLPIKNIYNSMSMPDAVVQDYNKCHIYNACDYTRRFHERISNSSIPKSMEFYRSWLIAKEVDPTKILKPNLIPTALYIFRDNSYVVRYNPQVRDWKTQELFLEHCAFFHYWIKNDYPTLIIPPAYVPNESEQNIIEILPHYDYTQKIEFPKAIASTSLVESQPYGTPQYKGFINLNCISPQSILSFLLLKASDEYIKNSHLYTNFNLPINILKTFQANCNNCKTYLMSNSNYQLLHKITTVRSIFIEEIKKSLNSLVYFKDKTIFPTTSKGYPQIKNIINFIKIGEKFPNYKPLLRDLDYCTIQFDNLFSIIKDLGPEFSRRELENLIRSHHRTVHDLLQKLSIEKELINVPLPYKKEKELSVDQLENLITTHQNRLQEQINSLDTYLSQEHDKEKVKLLQTIREIIQSSHTTFEQNAYRIYLEIQKLEHLQTVSRATLQTTNSCTVM